MIRIEKAKPGFLGRTHLLFSHSAEDVRKCMMNIAVEGSFSEASLKHLLLALYIRQPEMIKDFLGEVKLNELSDRLLGINISEDKIDDLYKEEAYKKFLVTSNEVDKVFEIAEEVASLVGHHKVGSAELFISLLMFSKRDLKLKELISEKGLDNKKIQRAFLECNISKHQQSLPLYDSGYSKAIRVSRN